MAKPFYLWQKRPNLADLADLADLAFLEAKWQLWCV